MFHTYRDACDLVVPPWMIAIVRGATFTYASAFPLWHLALTLERLLATYRAKKYEATGVAFGIVASVLVVTNDKLVLAGKLPVPTSVPCCSELGGFFLERRPKLPRFRD